MRYYWRKQEGLLPKLGPYLKVYVFYDSMDYFTQMPLRGMRLVGGLTLGLYLGVINLAITVNLDFIEYIPEWHGGE